MALGLFHGESNDELDSVAVESRDAFVLYAVLDALGNQSAMQRLSGLIPTIAENIAIRLKASCEESTVEAAIRHAIVRANEMVLDLRENIGITIVIAVWPRGEDLFVANVGDTRAYLFRKGQLEQLTVDDTISRALYLAGAISLEESNDGPWRDVNWTYLGSPEVRDGPQVNVVRVQPGDRFLLATRALTGLVSHESLSRALAECSCPSFCANTLCQLALQQRAMANIACIVMDGLQIGRKPDTALVGRLARALRAGEDCSFALHDALLETGAADWAEHFRDGPHPPSCPLIAALGGDESAPPG